MWAKFFGNENDHGTKKIGIVYGVVYVIELENVSPFWKWMTGVEVWARIRVSGKWLRVPYETMRAFERNWRIK
jgi:hypothetical protein